MIHLPDLFERVLDRKPALAKEVRASFERFEPWLQQSGMPFFPGYTDHSAQHISDVLNTAASLIADPSHDLLSPEDIAVLCIAVLLHDCGMHLTQDVFRQMVGTERAPLISGLDSKSWPTLWESFLAEASRFDQEKLMAVFGDAEPIMANKINLDSLNERDCLLIGEFVRRHHPRLAHEIALNGVSTESSEPLKLLVSDVDIRDLAGLVARSHGMTIRQTFEYLKFNYSQVPSYREIKAPFLMAVLRIADYIQVRSERALKALLSVKELKSPISKLEWKSHFAVRDVSTTHEDPEAIFVNAKPTEVKTYIKLVNLFQDIQRELDDSWATLGEVYGRISKFSSLGLSIRRIRSNLDDSASFAKTVSYIPVSASFRSSGPKLLQLLVGPLYDYEPQIGIRELLQNAVDATRERVDLQGSNVVATSFNDEVVVEIFENDEGTGTILVTDNGVGMTLETITKFFLVAGASFRNSDVWKKLHLGADGQSRVMRGGRFGVGALAAFLLGPRIKVRTRHYAAAETDGIEFIAQIDDQFIELRHCSAPIGTSIQVEIDDPAILRALKPIHEIKAGDENRTHELKKWDEIDWFVQLRPTVRYIWDGSSQAYRDAEKGPRFKGEFRVSSKDIVPSPDRETPTTWHLLPNQPNYKAIYWQFTTEYEERYSYRILKRDEITVNGIRIHPINSDRDQLKLPRSEFAGGINYSIVRPSLAIYDAAGNCPINLQRSQIAFERMGVESELAYEILLSTFRPSTFDPNASLLTNYKKLCDAVCKQRYLIFGSLISPISLTKKGTFLSLPRTFVDESIHSLFFVDENFDNHKHFEIADGEAFTYTRVRTGTQAFLEWFRALFTPHFYNRFSDSSDILNLDRVVSASIISNDNMKFVLEKGRVRRSIVDSLNFEKISDEFTLVSAGSKSELERVVPRLLELYSLQDDKKEISAWLLNTEASEVSRNEFILERAWNTAFGTRFRR